MSVCVFVKSHLTSSTITYSTGNGGQIFFSENASFQSYGVICHAIASYCADAQFFDDRAF